MRVLHRCLILVAVGAFLSASSSMTANTAAASAPGTPKAKNPRVELPRVRAATARYHDVAQAEADGYTSIGFCEPGEGCHWLKPSLVDATFDPLQPEILLYAPGPGPNGLRLVAVEYVVPLGLSPGAPEGFAGDDDVWREDTEGAGLWELTAWIWLRNPNGLFEQHNPKIP
jgi:hypothetical protein